MAGGRATAKTQGAVCFFSSEKGGSDSGATKKSKKIKVAPTNERQRTCGMRSENGGRQRPTGSEEWNKENDWNETAFIALLFRI
jgi:hypothetical protein